MNDDITELHDAKLWTANLKEYRALMALQDADEAFGTYARKCASDDWKAYQFEQTYGTTDEKRLPPHAQVELQSQVKASNDALEQHCQTYADPAVMAAIQLIRTIAPSIDAVETKIAVIKRHELDNDTRMVGDPFLIVSEDVTRLRGEK